MVQTNVKKEFKTKGGVIFNIGEIVNCTPDKNFIHIESNGKKCKMPYSKAYKYLNKFKEVPSINTLNKQVSDGVSRTPLGYKTEIDGNDIYGFPSWASIILGI